MTTLRPGTDERRVGRLPDLPEIAFRDDVEREEVRVASRTRTGRRSTASQRPTRAQYVPSSVPAREYTEHQRPHGHQARTSERIVLPPARLVVAQALPNLMIAVALLVAARYHDALTTAGVPLWAAVILAPCLLILLLTDEATNPLWRRAAVVNLLTLGAILPILSIHRYLVPPSSFDSAQGTPIAPIAASALAIVVLAALGLYVAILSREDPEYAGVLVLPACLLVPASSGAVRSFDLDQSLIMPGLVFFTVALATVVASLLPGALPALVGPTVLAAEFVLLSILGRQPTLPSEWTQLVSVLFIALILTAVALVAMVPVLSVWCGKVAREIRHVEWAHDSVP